MWPLREGGVNVWRESFWGRSGSGVIPGEEDALLALRDVAEQLPDILPWVHGPDDGDETVAPLPVQRVLHRHFSGARGEDVGAVELHTQCVALVIGLPWLEIGGLVVIERGRGLPTNLLRVGDGDVELLGAFGSVHFRCVDRPVNIGEELIADVIICEDLLHVLPAHEVARKTLVTPAETGALEAFDRLVFDNDHSGGSICELDTIEHMTSCQYFWFRCVFRHASGSFNV